MLAKIASASISPNYFSASAKYDASHVIAGGQNSFPSGGDAKSYYYSWDGSSFSFINSASAFGTVVGQRMLVQGTTVFRDFHPSMVADNAGIFCQIVSGGLLQFDAVNGPLIVYAGMYVTSDMRGEVYGYDYDATYVYASGRDVIYSPPNQLYRYMLDAFLWPSGGTPRTRLIVTSADVGRVYCCGGFIFVFAGGNTKKYTYNGAAFSLIATYAAFPNVKATDGTYLYGYSGTNLIAYDTALNVLQTLNIGVTVTNVQAAGGYIFTSVAGTTYIHTFDGANFAAVDTAPGGITCISM